MSAVVGRHAPVPPAMETKESPNPSWQSPLLRERLGSRGAFHNEALSCASDILRSESARVDGRLSEDFSAILRGNTVYLRRFVCDEDDTRLYDRLKAELVAATGAQMAQDGGLIEWSRHQIFENPTGISPVFNEIIEMLAEYFDLEVYATRLNYYRDGQQWKPQHHDSHAYGGGGGEREDFTVGITLGATRSLLFVHEASGHQFEFPQRSGDCFAFTSEVNTTFTHGVPRVQGPIGDRFSIIAWGRRRSKNERNGGCSAAATRNIRRRDGGELTTVEDAIEAAHELVARRSAKPAAASKGETGAPPARKKKNRLQ